MGSFGIGVPERLMPSAARWNQLRDVIAESVRVALIGEVQAFHAGPPTTVDVQVTVKELVMWNANAGQAGQPVKMQTQAKKLPLLQAVPVMLIGAGGWTATFPIQQGDECVVVFLDTSFDSWLQTGGTDNSPIDTQRHTLSNGIAIFGLRNNTRALENYSTSSAQIRSDDGQTVIDLQPNQITLTAAKVVINASSECDITAPEINLNGNVNIDGAVDVTGNKPFAINSSTVNLNASSSLDIEASGTTRLEGKTFLLHDHTLVQPGSGTSGPVA